MLGIDFLSVSVLRKLTNVANEWQGGSQITLEFPDRIGGNTNGSIVTIAPRRVLIANERYSSYLSQISTQMFGSEHVFIQITDASN
jgi:hypothetical protein